MEKEAVKEMAYDEERIGSVKIADDVVSMIAGIAAQEVDGVAGLSGYTTRQFMSKVGVKAPGMGVKVEVIGKTVTVDLSIVMEYGYNIPLTCGKVQDKVKNAIENMTSLEVADINIRISGVTAPKQ